MSQDGVGIASPPSPQLAGNTADAPQSESEGPSVELSQQLSQLHSLKSLHNEGFIDNVEYEERKSQLIDRFTNTSVHDASPKPPVKKKRKPKPSRPPPDFDTIEHERAVRIWFDPTTHKWHRQKIFVKIEATPFAKGGLRYAFHMQLCNNVTSTSSSTSDLDESVSSSRGYKSRTSSMVSRSDSVLTASRSVATSVKEGRSYVAKMSIEDTESKKMYFQDVEMQMFAKEWAAKFNACDPPKKIHFIKAWVVQLVERKDSPICGVERYIAGDYRKHNNNYGYVNEDERNTPQAFSHFTYHASKGAMLVCDIQGVQDHYTDPQIHNRTGEGFGKGNLGEKGIRRFLSTHRCNAICKYLRLPLINMKILDAGTMPARPLMAYQHVEQMTVHMNVNNSDTNQSVPSLIPPKVNTPLLDRYAKPNSLSFAAPSDGCCCTIL
eukprot:TRINITY_DN6350_c0_g3_i1.p1 TRINITY_DN6350_c0_g3~~TRINITY_DN6350_c0_g3_i1.p1  ORF type:complete len:436 (+),score=91.23 TRINITY_DN6350_c0_g3_i1:361-1668(+)